MAGKVIRGLAKGGDVVIEGRDSQVFLRGLPKAFHLQVVATFERRVETMMKPEGLEPCEAVSSDGMAASHPLRPGHKYG